MAWCSPNSPRPKKNCLQKSKVNKGIIHKEFVPAGKTINAAFIRQFWTDCYSVSGEFGQSCTGLENGCCSTIMPLHTVQSVCTNFLLQKMVAVLDHPRYYPDLSPADFFLFPRLKASIKGARFADVKPSTIVWKPFCDRCHMRLSLIVLGSCMNVVKRVLKRMATILKGNKEHLFVSFVLFVFW